MNLDSNLQEMAVSNMSDLDKLEGGSNKNYQIQ